MAEKAQTKKTVKSKKKAVEEVVVKPVAIEENTVAEVEEVAEVVEETIPTVEDNIVAEMLKKRVLEHTVVESNSTDSNNKSVIDPFSEDNMPTQILTAVQPSKKKAVKKPIAIEFDTWNGQYIM